MLSSISCPFRNALRHSGGFVTNRKNLPSTRKVSGFQYLKENLQMRKLEQEAVNKHFKNLSLPTRPKCETEASRRIGAYFAPYARAYATEES